MFPARAVCKVFPALSLLLLSGCGFSPSTTQLMPNIVSGRVMGGQQPVSNSTIQMYAVGASGDGSAATPQLTQTVTSDVNGNFSLNNLYSCTPGTLVYFTATGGNPGLIPAVSNPYIALMTAYGPCETLNSSTFLHINEVTTVAATSALAPYMTSVSAVGSSSVDASALQAAFVLANELVNTSTGQAPGIGLPAGYTSPTAKINTLANIISVCVNTNGTGTPCSNLRTDTKPTAGSLPSDMAAALRNLALNPSLNTAALFTLAPAVGPFQPTITAAPLDFSVPLVPSGLSGSLQLSQDSVVNGPYSAPTVITVTNTASSPSYISSIAATTDPTVAPYLFSASTTCTTILAPSASCTVSVTNNAMISYTLMRSWENGTLVIADSGSSTAESVPLISFNFLWGPSNNTATVPCTSCSMGTTAVGTTGSSVQFISQSSLNNYSQFSGYGFFGDTSDFIISGGCPTLVPYGSCPLLVVTFHPTKVGVRTAILSFQEEQGAGTAGNYLFTGTGN